MYAHGLYVHTWAVCTHMGCMYTHGLYVHMHMGCMYMGCTHMYTAVYICTWYVPCLYSSYVGTLYKRLILSPQLVKVQGRYMYVCVRDLYIMPNICKHI